MTLGPLLRRFWRIGLPRRRWFWLSGPRSALLGFRFFRSFHQAAVRFGRRIDHVWLFHLARIALVATVTIIGPLTALLMGLLRLIVSALQGRLLLLAIVALLPLLLLTLLLVAARIHLTLGLGQHSGVMLGMLLKVLGCNPIIGQLRVAGQLIVFLDDLLGCAAHFPLWTRAIKNPVYDIADGPVAVVIAALRPRS